MTLPDFTDTKSVAAWMLALPQEARETLLKAFLEMDEQTKRDREFLLLTDQFEEEDDADEA